MGASTLVSSQERRAAVVPRINRLSTADNPRVNRWLCSPIGLHRISVVRASEETSTTFAFDSPERQRTVLPWANRSVGVPFCPALPSPPLRRARSLAPTCPWYIRILDPTGKGSFVRACEESLQTCLFHSLESMRDSCSVGELIRRRPVLHGTAMFRPVVDDLLKITRYNYSFQNYRTCLA